MMTTDRLDEYAALLSELMGLSPRLFVDCDRTEEDTIKEVIRRYEQQSVQDISTDAAYDLLAEIAASLVYIHIDYDYLAARILVRKRHLSLLRSEKVSRESRLSSMYTKGIISKEVMKYAPQFTVDYDKDYTYDYMGTVTLIRSYLLEAECIQDMLLRVAIGIHVDPSNSSTELTQYTAANIRRTYEYMSNKYFIHASPTLFYAGTNSNQLSSCFLVTMKDDSLKGIYDTLQDVAMISKGAGGIGLAVSNIRARGSPIGTTGKSNGLVPMLKVFNETAKYVDQGGGKRKGAFAIYLEPWHADIVEFIRLKSNHATEDMRANDLFYGLWVPDLFMQRVLDDDDWSLFCPHRVLKETGKELWSLYGEEFNAFYRQCEDLRLYNKRIRARDLWDEIIRSQIETGTPYILYKDACNSKSNQKNLGTIKTSNLCAEVIQYADSNETAVCTLSSISLPSIVRPDHASIDSTLDKIDWSLLRDIVRQITINLDRVVDINNYPTEEARRSAMRHRAIGIGIQGLADLFCILSLPFYSDEAKLLNRTIAEHIYYYSLEMSCELAQRYGPYSTFKDSPFSQGLLQFDLWSSSSQSVPLSDRLDWTTLKTNIIKYGTRHSLLTAYMPTASTAQILGNNDCFEPYSSHIYNRKSLKGDFMIVNKHLVRDLMKEGLWNKEVCYNIMSNNGSIQHVTNIPQRIKDIYKTVWEIGIGHILEMARDRAYFIDQSQSMSMYITDGEDKNSRLTSSHINAWRLGLKTGIYYVRGRPAVNPIKFTIPVSNSLKDSDTVYEYISSTDSDNDLENSPSDLYEESVLYKRITVPVSGSNDEGGICTFSEGCLSCQG